MSASHRDSSRGSDASLARLLELDDSAHLAGDREPELATIFAHQLAAPLAGDLKIPESQQNEADQFKTFAGLLHHRKPAIWLLEETKQLAKQNRASADTTVRQIATMLYYCAIAAAMVHAGKRISDLSDDQLRLGLDWARQQAWLDPVSRQLIQTAIDSIAR